MKIKGLLPNLSDKTPKGSCRINGRKMVTNLIRLISIIEASKSRANKTNAEFVRLTESISIRTRVPKSPTP